MTTNKRIPVQILETKDSSDIVTVVMALCNDGTIWETSKIRGKPYIGWQQLPNILQPENTND